MIGEHEKLTADSCLTFVKKSFIRPTLVLKGIERPVFFFLAKGLISASYPHALSLAFEERRFLTFALLSIYSVAKNPVCILILLTQRLRRGD